MAEVATARAKDKTKHWRALARRAATFLGGLLGASALLVGTALASWHWV